MTDQAALDRLVDAVYRAHDPWERLASAVSGALAARKDGGEVARVRVEERPDGTTALRLTDMETSRAVEVVLDFDAARELGCRLSAAGARQAASARRRPSASGGRI